MWQLIWTIAVIALLLGSTFVSQRWKRKQNRRDEIHRKSYNHAVDSIVQRATDSEKLAKRKLADARGGHAEEYPLRH